jgi:antitoxin YefM
MVPLNEVKAKLSEMVGRAQDHHEHIVITVHGQPAAVLVSLYEWESLQETLAVLSDTDTMAQLRESAADPFPGASIDQVLADRRGDGG